jgi:hypothetical protein
LFGLFAAWREKNDGNAGGRTHAKAQLRNAAFLPSVFSRAFVPQREINANPSCSGCVVTTFFTLWGA